MKTLFVWTCLQTSSRCVTRAWNELSTCALPTRYRLNQWNEEKRDFSRACAHLHLACAFPMRHQAPAALFIALLTLSLFACAVLFSTFLSTSAASNGHSSFSSFAPGDGEAALWRKLSSFDRVAFVVIDALRSARVQVRLSLPAFSNHFSQLNHCACATGSHESLEKLSRPFRYLSRFAICERCTHTDGNSSTLESDDDG